MNQLQEQISDKYSAPKPKYYKGILVGVSIDVIGGFFVEFILSVACLTIYMVITGVPEGSKAEIIDNISDNYKTAFSMFKWASILFVPFIAGYFSALIVDRKIYTCAIVVGIITFSIGLLIGGTADSVNALQRSLFRNIISFVFILLGAHFYVKNFGIAYSVSVKSHTAD